MLREIKIGEHILLTLNPNKSSLNLVSCTKLAMRLCGPFEMLDRRGLVVYMLALLDSLQVHNAFHVSLLKKYVHDLNYVIE